MAKVQKVHKVKRVVSRAKTSGNLKNSNVQSRIKAVITNIRKK